MDSVLTHEVPRMTNINFLYNKINASSREKVMRLEMITQKKMLLSHTNSNTKFFTENI